MNIFKAINERISTIDKSKYDEMHLGAFKFESMDSEDYEQLRFWEPMGATLYEREIDGVTFTIDIETKDIRG